MKPIMKSTYIKIFLASVLAVIPAMASAQEVDDVLAEISRNNLQLKALRINNEAALLDIRAQNNIQQDISFSYSPFFQKGVEGIASSEMVVSMGFDFPTQYFARHKSGDFQEKALAMQYSLQRRDLMVEARNLCLDLVRLKRERILLEKRLANADELIVLVEKKFNEGGAGIIELNMVKMERMNVKTLVAQNDAAVKTAELGLRTLNGNIPVSLSTAEYPQEEAIMDFESFCSELMASDKSILAAQASIDAAEQEIKVNQQNWIPKFEVGYRRNTALCDASNGFLVGASIPIFSSRNKTKAAKSRYEAALAEMENARAMVESELRSKYNEMMQAYGSMAAYDVPLMEETIDALDKAVVAGQISIINYFTEADKVYTSLLSFYGVENQYHKLMTEVFKNRL